MIVPVLPGYEPVYPEYELSKLSPDDLKFRAVDRVLVASLIVAIQSGGKSRDEIAEAVRAVYATRKNVEPQSGDHFAMPGAFWIYPTYDAVKLMRANGVKVTLFIHDLIQISHPQYVHEDASKRFRHALVEPDVADLVITNSEYVAADVRRFMSSRLNFSVPVKAMPLATELRERSRVAHSAHPTRRDVQSATASPFVLSVSTIEVRKNHMSVKQSMGGTHCEWRQDYPDSGVRRKVRLGYSAVPQLYCRVRSSRRAVAHLVGRFGRGPDVSLREVSIYNVSELRGRIWPASRGKPGSRKAMYCIEPIVDARGWWTLCQILRSRRC